MAEEIKTPTNKLDSIRWVSAALLFAIGIYLHTFFADTAMPIRLAGWIILAVIIIAILAFTTKGKEATAFIQAARVELRRVIWPSRQETVKMTLIVLAFIVVSALFLWGIDTILFAIIAVLTGQRG